MVAVPKDQTTKDLTAKWSLLPLVSALVPALQLSSDPPGQGAVPGPALPLQLLYTGP